MPPHWSHVRYNNNNKHAYAGVNDFYTSKSPIGTPNTAAFWPTQQLALLGIIPPTEVTQRLVLWLGFYSQHLPPIGRPTALNC
jgi:hypothetical protein